MNGKMGLVGGLGGLWLVTMAPSAHGEGKLQEYIFEVPVTISAADARLVKGTVLCRVEGLSNGSDTGDRDRQLSFEREEGSESFQLRGGAYQGRVLVKLSTAHELTKATYTCQLGLFTADGKNAVECVVTKPQNIARCNGAAWSNLDSGSLAAFTSAPLPNSSDGGGQPAVRNAPGSRKGGSGILEGAPGRLKRAP